MSIFARTQSPATDALCLHNAICIKQLDMKGIPFLLIVLVGTAVVYTWMINQPSGSLPPENFAVRPSVQIAMAGPIKGKKASDGMPVPCTNGFGKAVTEGFQSNGTGCTPKVVPMEKPLTAGAEPTEKPGTLVSAPYNQVASTAPQYYRDPALQTASRERIITTTQLLRGFLSFEAPLMRALSDPTVQLPLTQAKADLPRLEQELVFLQSNPGLPSSVKVSDIMTIESNVDYLQQKYRLAVNNGVIQRPVSFQDDGVSASPIFNRVKEFGRKMTEGFTSGSSMVPEAMPAERATLADLKAALIRMNAEAARLSASGTNDPVMVARVSAINQLANNIRAVVLQVEGGQMQEFQIPYNKDDLTQIYANMSIINNPIANLLPQGTADSSSDYKEVVKDLADKYLGALLKGVSFELELKYTSENEAAAADKTTVNVFPQGLSANVNNAFGSLAGGPYQYSGPDGIPRDYNLDVAASGSGAMPRPGPYMPTDPHSNFPVDAGRAPTASGFDWKQRAAEICENARRRGLNPADFGCMASGAQVSSAFSWRGHVKMLCTRLKTNFYTGVDELCGCPPATWPGWRS
jgi:hypothetical protein